MADLDALLAAFEDGTLRRRDPAEPNFLDLVTAVMTTAGAPDRNPTDNAQHIRGQIGTPQHLVFVLVDGLGTHAFHDLPSDSWLRTHLVDSIQSVFPATTAAAITSIATASWPAQHGAVGWWTYLSQLRETACILPFTRVRDGAPLIDCGIQAADALNGSPILAEVTRPAAVCQPQSIVDSTYSTWFGAGAATIPYRSHADAAEAIAARIRDASGPTFTYWYTPAFDHHAHEHGAESTEARDARADIDAALGTLARSLDDLDARIALTADHGHLDAGARYPIEHEDPLNAFLRTPPSGDMRVGFYHLQDGARQAFSHEFQDRFGDHFALITTQQLEDLRLLGPHPLAEETRRRVGDFTSLALDDSVMRYTGGSDGDHFMQQRSHHSGLSPRETTIPLVIG